jgi:hypothetical protein
VKSPAYPNDHSTFSTVEVPRQSASADCFAFHSPLYVFASCGLRLLYSSRIIEVHRPADSMTAKILLLSAPERTVTQWNDLSGGVLELPVLARL